MAALIERAFPYLRPSISDVLQEPFGRDLATEPGAARRFVDLAGDRVELGALQVAALRIADLIGRGAAGHLALHKVGERDAFVGQRVAVYAPAPPAIAMLALQRARLIGNVLGVGRELRMPDRRRGVAETQIDIKPAQALRIGLASGADHQNMRALFQQAAVGDVDGGIGERSQDMRSLVDVLRLVADLDLDIVLRRHLAAEGLAVRLGRAEHHELLDGAYAGERLHMGARHATRAEHADDFCILVRHVLDADAAVAAGPPVLQMPVIEEGERLAVLDRGEQNEPAVETGPHAVFFLRHYAVVLRLVDDVRLHADREIAAGRAALHGAPLVVLGRIAGRDADVDARPTDGILPRQREIGLLQRLERHLHGQELFHVVVVDDQRHRPSLRRSIYFRSFPRKRGRTAENRINTYVSIHARAGTLHSLISGSPALSRARFCSNNFLCMT